MALGKAVVVTFVGVSIAGAIATIKLRPAPGQPVKKVSVPATDIDTKKVGWFDEWLKNSAPEEVKRYLD